MGKRFIDTNLYNNDFVRSMSKPGESIWLYLLLNVDLAGFIHLQFENIRFQCRIELSDEEILNIIKVEHNDRVAWGNTEKPNRLWIKEYIFWQKNFPLNPLNSSHKSILASMLDNADIYKDDDYFRYMFTICCIKDFCDEHGFLKKYIEKQQAVIIINDQKRMKHLMQNQIPDKIVIPGSVVEPMKKKGLKSLKELAHERQSQK